MTGRSSGPGRGHAGVRTLVRVMRLLLSPRWMVWHVLTLGAMVTCTWLAIWQWGRAGSAMGSALNVGYGLQWPLFAVFFGVMWWRFLSMEIADLRAASAGTSGDSTAAMDTDSPTVPAQQAADAAPSPVAETTPSALTTTARTTAAPTATAPTATTPAATTATTPATTPTTPTATTPDGTTAATTPAGRTATPAGPSPFTSRPANAVPPRSTDPQLRAYNEELARLAARHREESTP
ncbi:hypothetical protein [Pseudonocardia sp. ICBG1142]|uniref:hypothetical protein n=1 Tax=Pseudonocardia sp. ICBG1142 TaxID=2846760 RepID=UPI001CF611DA|nr:hypothetical protein [Pseudonocardia sp. ICBG1142]